MFSNRNNRREDSCRLTVGTLEFEVTYWHDGQGVLEPDGNAEGTDAMREPSYRQVGSHSKLESPLLRYRDRAAPVFDATVRARLLSARKMMN